MAIATQTISRDELKRDIDRGDVTVVEVLDPEEFRKFHLPGAINVPLKDQFEKKIVQTIPDKRERIVVYCANEECPASTNAAEKMQKLGYENVLDYVEGKEGWKEAGLPIES